MYHIKTPALQASEDAVSSAEKTPNRVRLQNIKDKVRWVEYIHPTQVPHMTICVLLLKNGFAVTGTSTPADAENFDEELGEQLAYEDALRRVWPLEGYILREYLADEAANRRKP